MTTVNTLLNIEDLILAEPSIPFDEVDEETKQPVEDIRFMPVLKNPGERDLTLRIYGKVASNLMNKFGDSFFFKPNADELDNLLALDKLTDDHVEVPEKYQFRSALNRQHQMNIKLKKDGNDYRATLPFTPATAKSAITRGKECCIEVAPSFYFSSDGDKHYYGIFYQLDTLKFMDEPIAVKSTKATKGKK